MDETVSPGYFRNPLQTVYLHSPSRALHHLTFPCILIQFPAVHLDGRVHRDLLLVVLRERSDYSVYVLICHLCHITRPRHCPRLVFCIRGKTECHTGKVAFFLLLHIFCQLRTLTDTDWQHTGHFRVQRASMAHFFYAEYLSHLKDHIMACHTLSSINRDYTMKHSVTSIGKTNDQRE